MRFGIISRLKKAQVFWDTLAVGARVWPFTLNKFPANIIIEVTNVCNLRCPVCPTATTMVRPRGLMDFELFKSLVNEIANVTPTPEIKMNFAGEPLMHPKIGEMVKYSASKGIITSISTNAVNLNKELAEDLIEGGLSAIRVCLDGWTKEAHEAYRIGSDFFKVKENIVRFLEIRQKKPENPIRFVVQTLATSFSENQISEIRLWVKKIGADNLSVKSLNLHGDSKNAERFSYLLPRNPEYLRIVSNVRKTICTIPLGQTVVYWNGDLGLCCIDYDNEVKFKNVAEFGLQNVLMSQETRKLRRKGILMEYGICKTCTLAQADFLFNVYS